VPKNQVSSEIKKRLPSLVKLAELMRKTQPSGEWKRTWVIAIGFPVSIFHW
jgi:hypothetical protein